VTEAERPVGPLAGRVALVTGASSGLGRATAVALAQAGADVALLARGKPDLDQTAAEVEQARGRALVLLADLADAQALDAAVARVVDALGRVDVLVNAAGTDVPAPVAELAVGDWDRVLAVNLRAPFVLAKAVFPHMRAAGGGTVVNVSSVAGKRGWAAAAYCSSKFALTGLTQALAAEGRAHGIRACVLYPGAMATSWGRGRRPGASRPKASGRPPAGRCRRRRWRRWSCGSRRRRRSWCSTRRSSARSRSRAGPSQGSVRDEAGGRRHQHGGQQVAAGDDLLGALGEAHGPPPSTWSTRSASISAWTFVVARPPASAPNRRAPTRPRESTTRWRSCGPSRGSRPGCRPGCRIPRGGTPIGPGPSRPLPKTLVRPVAPALEAACSRGEWTMFIPLAGRSRRRGTTR
jgi:NAD(P)-dependent dehydrogenase (short-subunit alcohol dehydrogenase family)